MIFFFIQTEKQREKYDLINKIFYIYIYKVKEWLYLFFFLFNLRDSGKPVQKIQFPKIKKKFFQFSRQTFLATIKPTISILSRVSQASFTGSGLGTTNGDTAKRAGYCSRSSKGSKRKRRDRVWALLHLVSRRRPLGEDFRRYPGG